MPHYIAFLRGMNLGKRRVKMEQLRALFEELKFSAVKTFIASGNVIFTAKSTDPRKLEKQIGAHLAKSLGYNVDTFVRTRDEIATIAAYRPFVATDLDHPDNTVHAGFLHEPFSATQIKHLLAARTQVDEFHVEGREFYWLCRIKIHESKVWASPQMKLVKLPTSSMRNLTTIRKLAALYPAPAG
ncbi:MAG TPA: DUF1697 domain-containing protein [Lacunisphaera sp.]